MRRHVENRIETPARDSLGILILVVMWALALMALSTAARGQETPPKEAAHPLPVIESNQTEGAQAARGHAELGPQPDTVGQITLTRFILISIPDRQLALVDNGQVVKIYSIAVGAHHTPSPNGNFAITSHVANPTWSHKGKTIGPGKGNPAGSRWMGLNLKGYGIHGTNAPGSIGKAASHGCFRMGKRDVEELFQLVRVGDTVAVRAQRDDLVAEVFGDTGHTNEVQVASGAPVPVDAGNE